jgi:hypothetical protein
VERGLVLVVLAACSLWAAPLELEADEKVRQAVEGVEFITRLRPLEVKVFAASRKWETPRRAGRELAQ